MDKEENPLKQIRTFQGDVAKALEKQRESLVSIQRAEKLKRGSTESPEDASSRRKRFSYLLLGSLFFIVLGIAGAWYAYSEFLRKTAPPVLAVPENRFISASSETILDVATTSRENLIGAITTASESIGQGEIKHIVLKKTGAENKLLSTSEFLVLLETRAPGSLVRAFDPLFMFGVLGESNFLIVKLASFENAFAGMLNWEKNLAQDLGPLFSTRELLRSLQPEPTFADVTDRNKDIRVLTVESQIILLYSFFDNDTLIITDNIATLRTLIDRLTQEKLSR